MRKEIIKANQWEIRKSGSLRTLGGMIALFHVLQFYFWSIDGRLPIKLAQQGMPMCWAMMENCWWMHFPVGLLKVIYFAYVVFASLAAAVLFLTEWVTVGFYLLLFTLLCGVMLYFQDLRLSTNDGYFIFFVTFAYLLVPSKHRLMRRLLVSFFVARGLSQCAADWLTGSWYIQHVHVPTKLAEWLAAMSVLVQMIGAAAMLFRDGRYFWSGWLTLFAFEALQLYTGEVLGASLAFGALLYLAFDELELRKAEREYIYQSFIRPEPSFLWGGILLGLFWAAQVAPFTTFAKASSWRTALNVFAVQPESAHEECEQKTFAVFKSRVEEMEVESQMSRQSTMACNPYLHYLDLKALCLKLKSSDADFVTLSSAFQVRNFRERSSYRAFEVKDFCAPNLTFNQLGVVRWTTNPAK